MIETIEFKGHTYPAFQATGNSMRFAIPFFAEVCKGQGLDVGCNRPAWCLPGAFPVDPSLNDSYDAMNLPTKQRDQMDWDFIVSSHCAEHLTHPYTAFNYWHSCLKKGGVLGLYLPDFSQSYWRPWLKGNSPHLHSFTPEIIKAYFDDQPEMWKNVFVSGVDLNSSFVCIAEKV